MRSFKASAVMFLAMSLVPSMSIPVRAQTDNGMKGMLEALRLKHGLPALAGAVVTSGGIASNAVTGVRKAGTDVPATLDDLWHLGSDTKAMTAVLIGTLVEEGSLGWGTSIGDVFPELVPEMKSEAAKITLLHLLSHRSGLPANLPWPVLSAKGPLMEQRQTVVKAAVALKLQSAPGAAFLYSNLGYVIAGAMAERVTGKSWEELLLARVCRPLGMATVGFGGLGTPGVVDQPWPHDDKGKPLPENGPEIDNPEVMGPAGTVHCSLGDWARFITDMLRGLRGEKALLKPEMYRLLTTPPFGGNYALGWVVNDRSWGGGKVFAHNGSNTMNLATAWLAPLRDFAVLIVTNQGGPSAEAACDEAVSNMIKSGLVQSPAK